MNLIKKKIKVENIARYYILPIVFKNKLKFLFQVPIKFYRAKIMDYNHACNLIFEYLEGFYNIVRIYSYCNHLSSNIYESNYKIVS